MRFPREPFSSEEVFTYETFSCDVDFFVINEEFGFDAIDIDILPAHNPLRITARFYDVTRVHETKDVHDLVAMDRSFGTITIEIQSDDTGTVGFVSGYLDAKVFTTQAMVSSAVYFVQDYLPSAHRMGFYHHICLFERVGVIEQNGRD